MKSKIVFFKNRQKFGKLVFNKKGDTGGAINRCLSEVEITSPQPLLSNGNHVPVESELKVSLPGKTRVRSESKKSELKLQIQDWKWRRGIKNTSWKYKTAGVAKNKHDNIFLLGKNFSLFFVQVSILHYLNTFLQVKKNATVKFCLKF